MLQLMCQQEYKWEYMKNGDISDGVMLLQTHVMCNLTREHPINLYIKQGATML